MAQQKQHPHEPARRPDDGNELMALERAWERQGLRRRDFIRLVFAGASTATIAGVLAACGGADPTATSAPQAAATTGAAPAATTGAAPTATTAAARPTTAATTAAPAATTGAAPTAAATGAVTGLPSGGKYSTLEPVGKKGGRVIEVSFADAKTMNPMLLTDTASGARTAVTFNALVDTSPDDGLPYPELAAEVPTRENGGISADGLTYTFKLRNDVKWHDGTPFTAKDVVYTYETMKKPELGSVRTSELNERVESVSAPNDTTVVFKMKKVVAPFLTDNMYGIVPQHILGSVPVADIKSHPFSTGDPKATIGTGPFKFGEWVKDDHATFVKNPAYFRGEPALDQYIFKVVKDANVVAAQLRTGEADYGGITPALFEEMNKQQNLNIARYDTYSTTYITFNMNAQKSALFQDKKVRQALAYGMDRDAMVRAIQGGFGVVAQGTEPVLSWAYAPDQMKTKYTYNPQRANQLLDEAGWAKGPDGIRQKDGKRLAFTIWTNAGNKVREQYITVMQAQWKNLGVEATPKTEEWNSFLTRINETRDFELYLSGFGFGVDPDQSSFWTTDAITNGFNRASYSNPQVDQLFAQALSELDREKRKQLYVEVQNILMDDLPSMMVDFPQALAAVNKRVHNLKPNAINVRWNVKDWWVEDGR